MTIALKRFYLLLISVGFSVQCAAQPVDIGAAKQPFPAAQNEFLVTLNVWPAAEPRPALLYQLRIEDQRLRDGDVMQGLIRAILASKRLQNGDKLRQQYVDRRDAWLANGIDENIQKEISTYLSSYKKVLDEMHSAAQYRNVSQDLRFIELSGAQAYGITLEDMQELRELGRLVELECKLAIAENRFEDALNSIQTGIRIAEAASLRTPTLIGKLVGVAIASMMLEKVREMTTMPKAPNLYWAIAMFPFASFDMQPAYEAELNAMRRFLGPIGSLDNLADEAAWRQKLIAVVNDDLKIVSSSMEEPAGLFGNKAFVSGLFVVAADGPARSYLAGQDIDPSKMSPSEAVLRAFDLELRSVRDQHYKWTLLPRSVRGDRMQATVPRDRLFASSQFFPPAQILADMLLPVIGQVENASIRLQRQVAFLATAEAIRMQAAKDGEFPDSIENLLPVPAWLEPTTTEPFEYTRLSPTTASLRRINLPASPKLEWQLMLQD